MGRLTGPLADAVRAHNEALAAQKEMRAAAARRAEAVRSALDSGLTPQEIADALGVKRERVYVMKKEGKD